jgi:hypothetical protein
MAYVVMQKGMEPPQVEQLKAAFRGIPGLTPADAAMMCKHSVGILVRGVEQNEAQQIQASLAAQGIESEVVEQSALPALPPMRHLMQVECTPDALMIHDPAGRSFPLAWRDIMLVAAGNVGVIDFKRTSTPAVLPMDGGSLGTIDQILFENSGLPQMSIPRVAYVDPNYETREMHHQRWMAEVVIRGGGLRYNLEAEAAGQPLFHYLAKRRTDDVTKNFQLVVQDICQYAPEAAVNRGAYYLREGNAAAFAYPSKNVFYDEMIWLLWRLRAES